MESVITHAKAGSLRPLLAYGHSMGGLILLHMAIARAYLFKALITTSPWLRLRTSPPAWKQLIAAWAARYFPSMTLSTGLKKSQMAYSNELEVPRAESKLNHRRMSAAMYHELMAAAASAFQSAAKLNTPILIIQGRDDPIMDPLATAEFSQTVNKAGTAGSLILLPGKKHEPHNDAGRDQLYAQMIQWFQQCLS